MRFLTTDVAVMHVVGGTVMAGHAARRSTAGIAAAPVPRFNVSEAWAIPAAAALVPAIMTAILGSLSNIMAAHAHSKLCLLIINLMYNYSSLQV